MQKLTRLITDEKILGSNACMFLYLLILGVLVLKIRLITDVNISLEHVSQWITRIMTDLLILDFDHGKILYLKKKESSLLKSD